jgi:hypothetical protein
VLSTSGTAPPASLGCRGRGRGTSVAIWLPGSEARIATVFTNTGSIDPEELDVGQRPRKSARSSGIIRIGITL